MLDLSDIVQDEDFTQDIVRLVSTETINNYGEAIQSTSRSHVRAIVTTPSTGQLNRYVDATTYKKAICVTGNMVFYPDNLTGQPDIFIYHNEYYVVVGVDDYRDFGYTRAYCCMTDLQSSASNGNYIKRSGVQDEC